MAKACVMVGWDDVPHLSAESKEAALSGIPPWQRDARMYGTPSLGAGAIYPIPETEILCAPFTLPDHWPRSYSIDPGWNRTAVIWLAWNPDDGSVFAYDEYYVGVREPSSHAAAINAKGKWMAGVIDPAAKGARGHDGKKLTEVYADLGLTVELADNAVVAGLTKVWHMLAIGQLKIFNTMTNTRNEMRLYRRNDKGEIIKENDHLMDALRYNVMSGRAVARVKPADGPDGMPWFHWNPPDWSG